MSKDCLLCTRREFLRATSLLAVGAAMPGFLARSVAAASPGGLNTIPGFKDDRILVVIQLGGGNDGLNTVVPYTDDNYHRSRPSIALQKKEILRLTDDVGLHPNLAPLKNLADSGNLTIVQGVGYPNPNRSHFRSMEIWQTASDSDRYSRTGWIGRYLDNTCGGEAEPVAGVAMGGERPQAFEGTKGFGVAFQDPESFGWNEGAGAAKEGNFRRLNDVYRPHNETLDFLRKVTANAVLSSDRVQEVSRKYKGGVDYPGDSFGAGLKTVAKMIAGGLPTRIYYVTLGGFDTHANQLGSHGNLMRRFADGVAAFQKDLQRQGNADRVLTLTFSEFGRRVAENASGGTDHGTAAPMFIIGNANNAGMAGKAPSLTDLDNGDLKYTTDFRSVYGSLLEQWLGAPSQQVLGRNFDQIGLIKQNLAANAKTLV
jgi:uncharacterized protein (DUF1501 family)